MRDLFRDHADQRIIGACFASHQHPIEQVARAALASGRQIAFLGRSMDQNVTLARETGLLDVPAGRIVDIGDAARYGPGELCIICTGSQGEPLSALSLMAAHEHKWVKISEDDLVVISAHAIPGNEANVARVIDAFHRAGAEVVHGGTAPVQIDASLQQMRSVGASERVQIEPVRKSELVAVAA